MKLERSQLINIAVLVASLGSVLAVWLTRNAPTTGEQLARGPRLFPIWHAEQISRIQLGGHGENIVLERNANADSGLAEFALIAPVRETADAAAVDKLLGALENASVLRQADMGTPKASLGLEPPARAIDLKMGGIEYHLALGGPAPSPSGSRYAELGATGTSAPGLVLIDKTAAEELSAINLDALRTHSLALVAESDVARIELHTPKLDAVLERNGARFFLAGEPKRRADRTLIDSLFFQLSRLSANPFLTLTEAEPALGANPSRLVLGSAGAPLTLQFGGPCPKNPQALTLVRRSPELRAACVSAEIGASLALTREEWIDHHAFSMHADEVEELELEGGGRKLSLVRKGTAFVLRGKNDTEVELSVGNRRIEELVDTQGELVPAEALAKLGLEPPRGRATLRSSAGTAKDVLEESVRVGARDEHGRVPLYREADGALLYVGAAQARSFQPDETLLRKRKLLEFGPTSLRSLEIDGREGKQKLVRDSAGNLELELPKGYELDGGLATELIQQLGALETERFVADANDGTFGLEAPQLSAHFTLDADGGSMEHVLRVGAKTTGGAYATLDDDRAVFILPRELYDSLDGWLFDRAALLANPQDCQSIQLADGAHTLTLTRHGDSWSSSPAALAPEKLADLLELLGSLRAEAATHTGPPRPSEGFDKPVLKLVSTPSRAGQKTKTVSIGAGDSWRGISVFYARVEGVDATFVLAQSKVRALRDAL